MADAPSKEPRRGRTTFPPWIVVALLWLPAVAAAEPVRVLEDPAGDPRLQPTGSAPAVDAGDWSRIDLRGLTVEENPADFTFRLQVEEAEPDADPGNGAYYLVFTLGDSQYFIYMYQEEENGAVFGEMSVAREAGQFSYDGNIVAYQDEAANEFVAVVPRDRLRDGDGDLPLGGQRMTDFEAWAKSLYRLVRDRTSYSSYGPVIDFMPDDGPAGGFDLGFGERRNGDAITLRAGPYYYTSNGEAMNATYDVSISNNGTDPFIAQVAIDDIPTTWSARLSATEVALVPGESKTVRVDVHAAGGHGHGSYADFRMLVQNGSGSDSAALRLGVIYHTIPQPAGHHGTLYLHARDGRDGFANSRLTMNTLEEDPQDRGVQARPRSAANDAVDGVTYTWNACLQPFLQQPVQFDASTGSLSASFASGVAVTGATLTGDVVVGDTRRDPECLGSGISEEEMGGVVAFLDETTVDLAGPGTQVEVPIHANGTSPFLPQPGHNLVLRLKLHVPSQPAATVGQSPEPVVLLNPGARLKLPLVDVHSSLLSGYDATSQGTERIVGDGPDGKPRGEESPGIGPGVILLAIVVIALRRGR